MVNNRGSVLVVDDHDETLRLLTRLLADSGYVVHGARSVADAVRIAAREPCGYLIADLSLPDGSGLELLPALRRHYENVRGIALTGNDGPELADTTRRAGFAAHLVKPVRFEDLLNALDAAGR
jgi:CheY-like chemotaxis protein